MFQKLLAVVLVVLVSSCAPVKWYQLPLTIFEGELLVPALVATSQELGLESFASNGGAYTKLEDGTQIKWTRSGGGDGNSFVLLVWLPTSVPEAEQASRFAAAKARADDIWSKAAAARAKALNP